VVGSPGVSTVGSVPAVFSIWLLFITCDGLSEDKRGDHSRDKTTAREKGRTIEKPRVRTKKARMQEKNVRKSVFL
jgi:hypothetical protein